MTPSWILYKVAKYKQQNLWGHIWQYDPLHRMCIKTVQRQKLKPQIKKNFKKKPPITKIDNANKHQCSFLNYELRMNLFPMT
jgi:hypothetical protein